MLKWLLFIDTMITKPVSLSFKKEKFFAINIILTIESKSHKYNKLYYNILYQFSITIEDDNSIILSEYKYIELPKYFLKLNNLFLFSEYIII